MGVRFTDEQQLAIDTLDRSVLVSAAAGSGKTAVLVERMLNIILNGEANVDEMLVVTFTKAAAEEMKLRLSGAIRKRIAEKPEDSARLREQLNRLYKAYISTMDSFARRVITEFFYEIDMEPEFGTCDDVQKDMLTQEAIDEMFEYGFEHDDFIEGGSFRHFLKMYSSDRSDNEFKTSLIGTYTDLRTRTDYFSWAYSSAEQLRITSANYEGSLLSKLLNEDAEAALDKAVDAVNRIRVLFDDAGLSSLYESKLLDEGEQIFDISRQLKEEGLSQNILDRISAVKFVTFRAPQAWEETYKQIKPEFNELRQIYKNELKRLQAIYNNPDFDTGFEEMNSTYEYTLYFIRLMEEFEKRFAEKKAEKNLMDFADMEHNAVRILKTGNTADILRRRFKFVFVDEFQDTNRIQDCLIRMVSRKDNIFRVGDIKQCIYRFRLAEPELFRNYYNEYSDPANQYGLSIDLAKNFRSNDATVRYINYVFERVMEGYDERARLNTGSSCLQEYDFIPEVHILYKTDEDGNAAVADILKDEDVDEEISLLSAEEAEAAYIAELAAGIIGREFHDTASDTVRPAEAKDIVILFRAIKSRGDIMARALRAKRIEAHLEEGDDYYDTVEVGVALSLLRCIDNMKRDIPLISSLHSEAFGWSASDLAQIRISHNEYLKESKPEIRPAFWEALDWYRSEGPEGELKDRARTAADRIIEWRRLSGMMPLDDFVWKVLNDSGYYLKAGAMNGGVRRQANLRILADRAAKYSRDGVASLTSFIGFLDIMRRNKIKNGQPPLAGSDENVIRITTIHKSKGLEYPFVIVGGLGHRYKFDTLGRKPVLNPSVGLGLHYVEPERKYWKSTFMQRAIISRKRREVLDEELRLLYVAMTRARNQLFLVGSCDSRDSLDRTISEPKSYLETLRNVLRTPFNRYSIAPLGRTDTDASAYAAFSLPFNGSEGGSMTEEAERLYGIVDEIFSYSYPYSDRLDSKAKYSVSELRRKELEAADGEESRIQGSLIKSTDGAGGRPRAAELGTAYHRIMEFLDFSRVLRDDKPDNEYIRESAELLHSNGAIEDRIFDCLDLSVISDFFGKSLGRRTVEAAKRGTLRKEKPFTLRTDMDGSEKLVQGVIDCCFTEPEATVLVDYKTVFIRYYDDRAKELDRIRREYDTQIRLYAEAIEKGTGRRVTEAYLYLFNTGEAVDMDISKL